ncbi:MAG: hypothetical protein ACP6IY_02335 [Promethearchaeia archaeon]
MVKRIMISGIKRKTTAIESTQRYFQTINLLINHLKRKADKEKIFELIKEKEFTLTDLLIATASIHIYHNLGLRVKDTLELSQISVDSTRKIELVEKKIFFDEIKLLLKDSLRLECNLLEKLIDFENNIIDFQINERDENIQDFEKEKNIKEIENQIEKVLLDIIINYPPFYFYDIVGDLLGITTQTKMEILEEASSFKEISVDIEKKLEHEEKEDKFIELTTLMRIINKIHKEFEFKSYKELQTQSMPVRMLKRRILAYNLNKFPISIFGLKNYKEANNFKKELIKKIELFLNQEINYDSFEEEMLNFLKNKLYDKLKSSPNDFIYFLESLNESEFNEIIFLLNKYGVYNILQLIGTDENLLNQVKKLMIRYNIDKYDIINLNDPEKNLIIKAKIELMNLDPLILNDVRKLLEKIDDKGLFSYLIDYNNKEIEQVWELIKDKLNFKYQDLKDFIIKKRIIDKIFLQDLGLNNYSQILLILNFNEIIENLAKQIFFFIFSKILRQLSRIIESYQRITNDKTLILLALKKINTIESDEWVKVKLEELIIKRLIKRQSELVIIFNSLNNPFLVNGFILARLKDSDLTEGINELKTEESPIYDGIAPLSLKSDIISPISYCIAYDIIKRFEFFEELRKLKIEQISDQKEKEKEELKKELRAQQEKSTLNWIERRITSSLMRINSPGINPNQLYWQEKDTKIAADNLKLHSELKGNPLENFSEYFIFAINKIKSLVENIKLPTDEKIKEMIYTIISKVLEKRLGPNPPYEQIESMLEGERFEIAKQIAIKIGKLLDKALYIKFKNKKRNG